MRLMILGGGSSQISVFRRARELGIETVLADRDATAPAHRVADHFVEASTFDPKAVTRAADASRCDAILAVGTDQPVYTAAVASHRLKLPFPLTPEQATAVTNKRVMKARFDEVGIPAAPWGLFRPGGTPWREPGLGTLRPPFVVKPVDSQGQRGIILAEDRTAAEAHYPVARSFSREDEVLVEEYIPSVEITVSGWAHTPHHVEIWTITDRVTIDNPPRLGVCLAHRYPSLHAGNQVETIRKLTRRIVSAFGLSDCPIYFQMLIPLETVGGQAAMAVTGLPIKTSTARTFPPVFVNEIAARLGGAYEDQSIPLVTAVDVLTRQLTAIRDAVRRGGYQTQGGAGAQARHLEGSSGTGDEVQPIGSFFSVPLMFAHPGAVARLEGDVELRRIPGIADCRFLLPEGTVIRPMENSTQRIAYAVLHAESATAINALVDTLFDRLRVLSPDGTNLLMDTRGEVRRR